VIKRSWKIPKLAEKLLEFFFIQNGVFGMQVSCAKTTELMEVLFGSRLMWAAGKGHFRGGHMPPYCKVWELCKGITKYVSL